MKFLREYIREFIVVSRQISFVGVKDASLYDILKGLEFEAIFLRAAAMAFNFFLALFPTIIFLFTCIAYLPDESLPHQLIETLSSFFPDNIYSTIESTIEDILSKKRGGLLSFGFLLALIFSSNGVDAALQAFNKSHLDIYKKRPFLKRKFIAFVLLISIFVLMITSLIILARGGAIINYWIETGWLAGTFSILLTQFFRWVIVLFLSVNTISMLYYFGTSTIHKKPFLSLGSALAGFCCIITSLAFTYFVNQFGQYNKIYGSIGTIMALLLWLYFNSIVILSGYEITNSILKFKFDRKI